MRGSLPLDPTSLDLLKADRSSSYYGDGTPNSRMSRDELDGFGETPGLILIPSLTDQLRHEKINATGQCESICILGLDVDHADEVPRPRSMSGQMARTFWSTQTKYGLERSPCKVSRTTLHSIRPSAFQCPRQVWQAHLFHPNFPALHFAFHCPPFCVRVSNPLSHS